MERPQTDGACDLTYECHGLDTQESVFFYEQDFYVLSNFSAFTVTWKPSPDAEPLRFDTSEALYHWLKFAYGGASPEAGAVAEEIRTAPSAHEAFRIAQRNAVLRRPDWDDVKVASMKEILRAKVEQHEYVARKLLATGDRLLVENSWRDSYWGWGEDGKGLNVLGRLWMEIRDELRARTARSVAAA